MANEFETPIENEYEERVIVLATELNTDIDNITDGYADYVYDTDEGEYMILDDNEANDIAREDIEESLWAFNPEFIIAYTNLPYDAVEIIRCFQERCENANEAIYALIGNMDEFVDDAISADGRAHFLNTYDGEEIEADEYFIYRMG